MSRSRGSVLDNFVILVFFVVALIFILAVWPMTQKITRALEGIEGIEEEDTEMIEQGVLLMDWWLPLFIVGMFFLVALLAFLIDSPAPFAIIAIIIWLFQLLAAAALEVAYVKALNVTMINDSVVAFPLSTAMMNNLLWIQFGFGIFVVLLIYAKVQQQKLVLPQL